MTTKDKEKDIDYDFLVDNALRGVVKIVLQSLERKEKIGEHHFFITFLTQHESVNIPNHFLNNHPNIMTIVLQHQFWDLKVNEDSFSVTLSFNGKQEKLLIGYEAITQFTDPSTDFALQFSSNDQTFNYENYNQDHRTIKKDASKPKSSKSSKSEEEKVSETKVSGEIISFDKFKKKK